MLYCNLQIHYVPRQCLICILTSKEKKEPAEWKNHHWLTILWDFSALLYSLEAIKISFVIFSSNKVDLDALQISLEQKKLYKKLYLLSDSFMIDSSELFFD